MLIDWFTVGAQALNFLILVWLMKRFLYQPILDAIDAREKRIKTELADADAKKAEAEAERDAFQRKHQAFDQQRADLLSKAAAEAKVEGQRIVGGARDAADALTSRRQEALRNEAESLGQALRRRTQHEVFAIARKALTDLASITLEERLVDVFIRRLRSLDDKAKQVLADALTEAQESAALRSAFELSAEQRATIEQVINESFSIKVRLRFETVPDLIGGIEFSANGQGVAWSISDYLTTMEQGVVELLDRPTRINVPSPPSCKPVAAASSA